MHKTTIAVSHAISTNATGGAFTLIARVGQNPRFAWDDFTLNSLRCSGGVLIT
jgi:hypothetical protein